MIQVTSKRKEEQVSWKLDHTPGVYRAPEGVWGVTHKLQIIWTSPIPTQQAKLRWVLRGWLLCQRIWKIPSDQLNQMFLCTKNNTFGRTELCKGLSHVVLSSCIPFALSIFTCTAKPQSFKYPEMGGCLFVEQLCVCWHLWISETMRPKTLPGISFVPQTEIATLVTDKRWWNIKLRL